jgi:hypothetical protein
MKPISRSLWRHDEKKSKLADEKPGHLKSWRQIWTLRLEE